MKSTWTFVLALAVLVTGAAFIADDSSAATFPSVDEIITTIQPPDYSFDQFVDDAKYMFSDKMIEEIANYGKNLANFVTEETFVKDISEGNKLTAESFTSNYINLFVLLCAAIAVICIVGAVLSYLANRKTFVKHRDV